MQAKHSKIKQFLVKTPLYHLLLRSRSIYEYKTIVMFSRLYLKVEPSTAYCISPYKTGTTYMTGLFKNTCKAAHEPLQYTTLLNMDNVEFLKKRARYLNLDIECSGFFANRLACLREFAPNAPVLFLSRSPEAWIGSVVNYFSKLGERVSYNYVTRMVFDPICEGHIEDFYTSTPMKQAAMVTGLLDYWISVYTEARNDPKTLIVPLEKDDEHIIEIEEFMRHKSHPVVDCK